MYKDEKVLKGRVVYEGTATNGDRIRLRAVDDHCGYECDVLDDNGDWVNAPLIEAWMLLCEYCYRTQKVYISLLEEKEKSDGAWDEIAPMFHLAVLGGYVTETGYDFVKPDERPLAYEQIAAAQQRKTE